MSQRFWLDDLLFGSFMTFSSFSFLIECQYICSSIFPAARERLLQTHNGSVDYMLDNHKTPNRFYFYFTQGKGVIPMSTSIQTNFPVLESFENLCNQTNSFLSCNGCVETAFKYEF